MLLFVAVITASCSSDESSLINADNQTTSLSVLDGDLLSYKDDASFIMEYSKLSELKTNKEIQEWTSKKGHLSLLNTSDKDFELQDSIISDNRIIYSDALKAVLNSDSKFKVNGKVIWLDKETFYELSEKDYRKNSIELKTVVNNLIKYGSVTNGTKSKVADITKNSKTSIIIPSVNGYSVSYSNNGPNSKRYNLTIFNESVWFNGIFSSKMYVRTSVDYRSCSFWRCTWKYDTTTERALRFNLTGGGCWVLFPNFVPTGNQYLLAGGVQTVLLADLPNWGPCGTDFNVTGTIETVGLNNYIWTLTL